MLVIGLVMELEIDGRLVVKQDKTGRMPECMCEPVEGTDGVVHM